LGRTDLSIFLLFDEKGEDMRKLRIEGDRIDELFQFLSRSRPGDEDVCKANIVKEIGGRKIGFFVFEGFYFRVQNTVSGSMFVYQTDSDSCEVVIVGSGGASMLGVTWGAQKDIEKKISYVVLNHVAKIGMKGYAI
jgi:hypothetical protein